MHRQVHNRITWPFAALLITLAGCDSDNPAGPDDDEVPPTVESTNPLNGSIGVAVITATFSESMDASSITESTFLVTGPGGAAVAGTVTYNDATHIARFTPTTSLAFGTAYTATITTGVEDAAGNDLSSNYVWGFTTALTTASQTPPSLGTTEAFVVLAGSAVANTGASALTGDLGVSPGTAITGFPPGTITGTTYAGDATAATAMTDLTTAYNDVVGRTTAPVTVAGNIGGLTLPPGLYKSGSTLSITTGDLTLDAQGNDDAIFVFQVASSFMTGAGRSIVLTGGAKASNVFWQVGNTATLGASSTFKGNLMANQSITMGAGATMNGRALVRVGAVTLSGNALVTPTP